MKIPKLTRKASPLVAAVTVAALTGCGGGDSNSPPPAQTTQSCASLAGTSIGDGQIATAAEVPASGPMPAYCAVTATIAGSNIKFAARLPDNWNGKMHMGAGGGWQGTIAGPDRNAIPMGYVDYATDSGHSGGAIGQSAAAFVFGTDADALPNFASESYPKVSNATRDLAQAYYGKSVEKSYFEGCSGAGRIALVMAQRFPALFDGIIAGSPGENYVGVAYQSLKAAQAMATLGHDWRPGKLTTLSKANIAACDALDGVVDGIISNPAACHFDPSVLRCAPGTDTDACLTDPELTAITTITSDSVLPNGVLLSKGVPLLGQQDLNDEWNEWFNNSFSSGGSFGLQFGESIAQVLTRDPTTNGLNYNPNLDVPNVMNLSALTDAWPGNLSAFAASKGKVIIWDGTTSIPVPYTNHIEYYNSAAASLGGAAAAANTIKMYFLPGVDHCGGGNGAGTFNFLQALDTWVETNTSADGAKVQKLDASGTEILSRPLCAYPQYPKYVGPGASTAASSFVCSN